AREGADALHSLCPEELCFDFSLFGDVSVYNQNGFRLASIVPYQCPTAFDDDFLAVSGELSQLAFPFPRAENCALGVIELHETVTIDDVLQISSNYFLRRPSVYSLRALVP